MSGPANPDWLYYLIAGLLAAAGLFLLLWFLFRDRSRGRRRCPRCWYDLAATPGLTCPECGHTARSERRLFRTRRRWRLAALSLPLFAAAYFAVCWPMIKAGGWLAPIPTRILLEFYPWTGPNTKLGDALLDRYSLRFIPGKPMAAPTDAGLITLINRASRGNWLARPTDPRWRKTYGEVLRTLNNRISSSAMGVIEVYPGPRTSGAALTPALQTWAEVPVVVQVRTRPKWPRGMPITIEGKPEMWWPNWISDDEELTWSANGGQAKGKSSFRWNTTLSPGLTGHIVIEGTIRILQEDYRAQLRPKREFTTRPFRFEYDTVDSIDEVMQPVGSPELDAFFTSSLTAVFSDYSILNFTVSQPIPPGYDDAVFAATLEILAGNRVLMTAHIRGIGLAHVLSGLCTYGDVNFTDNDPDADRLHRGELDPSWRVRIRTDPQWALSELDGEKYWKGEFTIPLAAGKVPPVILQNRTPQK